LAPQQAHGNGEKVGPYGDQDRPAAPAGRWDDGLNCRNGSTVAVPQGVRRTRGPAQVRFHYRAAVPTERLILPADARFWPQAARAVVDFASGQGLPARQLHTLTWLVPGGGHATLARAALREHLGGAAFMPPRISPLAAWLGRPLRSGTVARAELFAALRANAWVRDAFGPQPAALWSLAAGIAQLADELTWAAVDDAEAFAGRLQASLARHFRRRAARALQPQAQLVLQLWRARRDAGDGATAALRELQARAASADAPLVYLAGRPGEDIAPWAQAFLQRWSQRAPVLLIDADVRSALDAHPLLAAAWPELAGAEREVPIARRGDALARDALAPPLEIRVASSLEEEAGAVARQVLDWRRAGVGSIALVALDRLTARRVRALLERAQVAVRDETGWKLSTTSAAAALMRWYDLVADDLYWRDLLDWLKSGFTLAGRPNKAQEVAFFERAIRAGGALQGAGAIRRALADYAARAPVQAEDAAGVAEVLERIVEQRQVTQRAGPTLAAHLRALGTVIDALGMRAALADDPVGRSVLRELDLLGAELAGIGGRASLAEFRALLAARFEEAAFVDTQVDSPVVMVSLAATSLRHFDAAVLIGADAQHLPAVSGELLFMSNAVRAELGLSTAEGELSAQGAQLVALLASVPRVTATWRMHRGDEPNPLSPVLQRLQLVCRRALGDDLLRRPPDRPFEVRPLPAVRPAPGAAALLPDRVSASQCQSLVDCAYQFLARRMLGLAEPDDVIELPDKRDFGEALHKVLRRFHEEWGDAAFDSLEPVQLAASLRRHAARVFEPLIEGAPAMLAFARRFDGLVDGYVDWLRQHAGEGWRFRAGEARHALRVALRDGRAIELHGRVDRIDANAQGQLQVLDYKAKSVDALKKALKEPGEDIQLPFYGLLLGDGASAAAYVSFDRARDDEGGVGTVAPAQPFDALVGQVTARLRGDLQRIADGAPLPAIGAEAVCAHCEMRGLCRRDHWTPGDDEAAP
jgi:ATP-dependent helicase/nuclease subunit B